MRGTVLTFFPGLEPPKVEEVNFPLPLEFLKERLDGGYLELVPGFNQIEYRGAIHVCAAFCDEDGKRKNLPFNTAATDAWEDALPAGLRHPATGFRIDVLVGPVVVCIGDDEFMESL